MGLEIKQSLKLTQQLIMTPQLQQAIKLLQLSRLELLTAIDQELEINPILEETLSEYEDNPETDSWEPQSEGLPLEKLGENEPLPEIKVESQLQEDFDWSTYLEDKLSPAIRQEYESRDTVAFENMSSESISLKTHLIGQLQLTDLNDTEKVLGAMIIGNLNEDGYLKMSTSEIAAEANTVPEQVEAVLKKIQEFDPAGVAARDLKECLLVQADFLRIVNPWVRPIIERHLKNLENKNYPAIARDLKIGLEEVNQAVEQITQLEPRPGRLFDSGEIRYINPDIYVYKMGDEYVVTLNEDGLPKLRINSFYRDILTGQAGVPETAKSYIQNRLRSAVWFIKSIHQRQKTIYRVSKSIVSYQREFLEKGIAYLRPLTLRQIAEDVQMHESTISRVTTNKYMHTPQGVFELKYFFNSGITRFHGEQVASESVKDKIRQIVMAEDVERPHSDQDIADMLKEANILIARRTVAKYREMLGLLSSSKRKKPSWNKKEVSGTPLT
jgi:RNA polymerase sigma-54 factor